MNFPAACAKDVRSFDDIASAEAAVRRPGRCAASLLPIPSALGRALEPDAARLRCGRSQRDVHTARRFQPARRSRGHARTTSHSLATPISTCSTRWARPTRSWTPSRSPMPSATRFARGGSKLRTEPLSWFDAAQLFTRMCWGGLVGRFGRAGRRGPDGWPRVDSPPRHGLECERGTPRVLQRAEEVRSCSAAVGFGSRFPSAFWPRSSSSHATARRARAERDWLD